MSKIAKGALYVFGALVVLTAVGTVMNRNNPQASDTATYNTTRNAFISGCDQGGVKIATSSACSCMWNKLDAYYKLQGQPKWYTDTNLVNRITSQGYNQAETNTLVGCIQ